jgi:hypothetical protein
MRELKGQKRIDSRDGSIGDPSFATVQNETTVHFLSSGFHASRVGAMVGFRQSL